MDSRRVKEVPEDSSACAYRLQVECGAGSHSGPGNDNGAMGCCTEVAGKYCTPHGNFPSKSRYFPSHGTYRNANALEQKGNPQVY